MPKFLITVIASALVFWWMLWKYLNTYLPDSFVHIFIALSLLFIALAFTLSLPIYFVFYKQAPTFSNLRLLYRKSLKRAFFLSLIIVFIIGLLVFDLANIFTISLSIILFLLFYTQLSSRK